MLFRSSDLENKTVAISRIGSGSHLMSIVNAQNQNWNTENLQFEIVNTIDGAVDSLTSGKADYFMWERFMTQPLVDKGIFVAFFVAGASSLVVLLELIDFL